MKCKNCEAELDEGVTLCPECGCDNAPAEEATPVGTGETTPEAEPVELVQEPSADDNAQPEAPSAEEMPEEPTPVKKGMSPGKIALMVALIVAAIAVVVALVAHGLNSDVDAEPTEGTVADETVETTEATIPADGNPDDVTCKGTYTVSDEEVIAQKDTVVATLGDAELTNGELQVYYWMQFYDFMNNYGSYASYFGLDYTQSFDTQLSIDSTTTWQQYFLDSALNAWHTYSALAMQADEAGYQLEQTYAEFLETLPESMEESAATSGFESVQAMLETDMGAGVDLNAYVSYMEEYYRGYLYYNQLCDAVVVEDQDVEAYFDKNAENYAENGLEKGDDIYVDVRHILVMPEAETDDEGNVLYDDEGNAIYSEEAWEACRASAQAILDEWLAGEATEDSFAALANEHSEDPGSNTNGGLYENVYEGQMVEPFEDWCFDETRQYGDTGIVETTYGCHVMFYVDSTPVWYATAQTDLYNERYNQILEDAMASYELEVRYNKIVLGNVDFGTTE